MQLKSYLPYFLFFVLLVTIAFGLTYNLLDPDFGWHIKSGELILERGIPYQDWYSFSMPNFPWVNHEWLMDIFMYWIYSAIGMYGLLLVFLVFYTTSFFIIQKPKHFLAFALPVALGFLATTEFLGLRPQLFTVFFVALLMWLLDAFLGENSKLVWLLPLLFLTWVNLHASFFAGLFILCVILVCEVFKKILPRLREIKSLAFLKNFQIQEQPSQKIWQLAGITLLCCLITLANPYGIRIYEELFRTIGDSYLKFHITEWFPLFLMGFKPLIYLYLAILVASIALFYKKIDFTKLVLVTAFFLLSLSSIRYFLVFVIVSLPVLVSLVDGIQIDSKKLKQLFGSFSLVNKGIFLVPPLAVVICLAVYASQAVSQAVAAQKTAFYPEKAISFLKTLPLSENMLNDYTFGGYLIWKLPERKVFIDGRMPSWRLPANEAGHNGRFAFKDYIEITEVKEGFEKTLKTYDIRIAVIQASIKNGALYNGLLKLGFTTAYEDEAIIILRKP